MHVDPVAILRDRAERSLLTIDQHLSNFRVWHSERLGQMLNGLTFLKIYSDNLISLTMRQKVTQSAKKLKIGCAHSEIIFPLSSGLTTSLQNILDNSTSQYLCYK